MARLPRLTFAGQAHQLLQRGHDGRSVFGDDDDRRSFLAALADAARREQVAVHGYALLDNELRLLATPATDHGLGRLMQALGRRHGAAYNRRHGAAGTLWAGRFAACAVEADPWVLRCLRWVELAAGPPLADAAVASLSSAAHHLGRLRDPLISEHPVFWALGNTPFEREARWAALLERAQTAQETLAIAEAVRRGWPLGGPAFRAELGRRAGRPVAPRPVGRPLRRNLG